MKKLNNNVSRLTYRALYLLGNIQSGKSEKKL